MNKIDMTIITNKFFRRMKNYPDAINRGNCFNWAMAAYIYFRGRGYDVRLLSDSENCHAFVEIDGVYYDSETPCGTNDFTELECYRINQIDVGHVSEHSQKEFLKRWREEWPHTRHGKNRVWGPVLIRKIIGKTAKVPRIAAPSYFG